MVQGLIRALCVVAMLGAAAPRASADPRVVEIAAKRFQFTPSEIVLKRGEPVLLRVRSDDVTHGFFSRPLGIDTDLAPGQVAEVAVTPREAGRFAVICHHFCGSGHGGMKMTIVVE